MLEDARRRRADGPPAAEPWLLTALRDRALLLVGFAGAFRCLELVGLDVEDLTFSSAGVAIRLPRSKTDQEGQLRRVGSRRLYDRSVARASSNIASPRRGWNPEVFAGHSLRSGFATSAGLAWLRTAPCGRHAIAVWKFFRAYVRDAELFDNAAGDLGL